MSDRTNEPMERLVALLQGISEPTRTALVEGIVDLLDAVSDDTWDGVWTNPSPSQELKHRVDGVCISCGAPRAPLKGATLCADCVTNKLASR